MNEKQVLAALKAAIKEAGGYGAFGREHGMSDEYVRMVDLRMRPIGDRILAALRIKKIVKTTYRRIK